MHVLRWERPISCSAPGFEDAFRYILTISTPSLVSLPADFGPKPGDPGKAIGLVGVGLK